MGETSSRPSQGYAFLCLLAAFVSAIVVVAGATQWLPSGAAGIDHIILPIVLFPVVWIVFGLGLFGSRTKARTWGWVGALTLTNLVAVASGFLR